MSALPTRANSATGGKSLMPWSSITLQLHWMLACKHRASWSVPAEFRGPHLHKVDETVASGLRSNERATKAHAVKHKGHTLT